MIDFFELNLYLISFEAIRNAFEGFVTWNKKDTILKQNRIIMTLLSYYDDSHAYFYTKFRIPDIG